MVNQQANNELEICIVPQASSCARSPFPSLLVPAAQLWLCGSVYAYEYLVVCRCSDCSRREGHHFRIIKNDCRFCLSRLFDDLTYPFKEELSGDYSEGKMIVESALTVDLVNGKKDDLFALASVTMEKAPGELSVS